MESPSSAQLQPRRIVELDGIRGLAILLVLLYHYVAVPIPVDASRGLLFIRQLLSDGWSGVDLFFVLSGLLIGGILIDNRSATNFFGVFYTRRICRIFPLYYFFLVVFLVLGLVGPRVGFLSGSIFVNSIPMLPYFLYIQNYAMALQGTFGNEFLAMSWSLAIEEQFYLVLPLIVRRSLPRRLPLTLLFFIALSLILRATLAGGSFQAFVLTPWRLDGLFLGAFLAFLIRTPGLLRLGTTRIWWVRVACVAMFLYIAYGSMTEPLGGLEHIFLFSLFYATLIFLTITRGSGLLAKLFRLPWLADLGRISYCIYLFHQMVNGLVHDILFRSVPRFSTVPTIAATLAAAGAVYLLAKGTYWAFENRFIVLGHKSVYSTDQCQARGTSVSVI